MGACLALFGTPRHLAQHTDIFFSAKISALSVVLKVKEHLRLLPYRTFKQHDHHRAWFRLLNAVLRGATAGFCLR